MVPLSHKLPTIYGSGMGMVWEASQKGVPFLGVPGISLNNIFQTQEQRKFLPFLSPV